MKNTYQEFGDYLKEVRELKGLSVEYVGVLRDTRWRNQW